MGTDEHSQHSFRRSPREKKSAGVFGTQAKKGWLPKLLVRKSFCSALHAERYSKASLYILEQAVTDRTA